MSRKPIEVSSHVSRDLLQNAAFFSTMPKVVWEYVSNSLDNAREGFPVNVVVDLEASQRLVISDDGTGMSRNQLRTFFQMHGVNVKRKRGKRVRGRFGTGKSAAFGIARCLRVDTVQDGKRNIVELRREDIETAKDGEPFPVREISIDEDIAQEDGTRIEISNFIQPRLDLQKTITYVEKNLARYKGKAKVVINGHECRFREPPSIYEVVRKPPAEVASRIGDVDLTIKVSPIGLSREEYGIDILANGIWHETTLAEVKGDQSDRLFGEVEVPILDNEEDEIPAFDSTRNNLLNRANPRVVVLLAWLHDELEEIRKGLVTEEQQRKKSEQAKKLRRHAKALARILNEDFNNLMDELEMARRIKARKKVSAEEIMVPDGPIIPGDGDSASDFQEAGKEPGEGPRGTGPVPPGINRGRGGQT